jgi:hypothetical protein
MNKLDFNTFDSTFYQVKMNKAYKSYIDDLSKNGKDTLFINSSASHASIVLSAIFKTAKNCIKMLSGNLAGDVSASLSYQNEIENYLDRGGSLEIILDNFSEENPPKILDLLKFHKSINPNKILLKSTSAKVFKESENGKSQVHFCVADDRMYRLEIDTNKYVAEGNFNNANEVANLTKTFEALKKHSTTISIIE